ncbi:hypothetical protein E2C01_050737 [Portunus trituberculatus]|uniref:Uncharacterized protein n=1 Tax=Portunus trituberculatus TaxID=210409 RepID=A0A5B7G9S0_PORTR|nr:hypothetical protein [Portunus trituberculatus]
MQRPTGRAPQADHRREALDVDEHCQNQTTVEVEGVEPKVKEEDENEEIDVNHIEEDDDMEYGDEDEEQERVHVTTKTRTADTLQPTPRTRETRSSPAVVIRTAQPPTADREKATRESQETTRAVMPMLERLKRNNPHVKFPPTNIKIDEKDPALPTQQHEEWMTVRRRHKQKTNK